MWESNYINSKIDTPYQSFLVNKDENGNIWLKDPGMYASVNISTMSREEKKKLFRAKELLDRIVEKEQKKKECEELLHQYMLEQSSCRKRNIRYEAPFYCDTKWYNVESQSENKGYPKTLKK